MTIDQNAQLRAPVRSESPRVTTRRRPSAWLKARFKDALYGEEITYQPQQLNWLGVQIDNTTDVAARLAIADRRPVDRCRIVNFVNPHCLNVGYRNATYRQALGNSDLVLPDGSGLKIAGRIRGEGVRANLNGTDLFPRLCGDARALGLSIYLLGARPGIAEQVAENMTRHFPGLHIAGTQDGYFDPAKSDAVIAAINDSGADLLFVAMGVPTQELWLAQAAPKLKVRTALGVGGLFDFYSGRISRAPVWLREIGLEWVWRLLQEPGRMWRRYVLGNPLFLYRIYREQRRQNATLQSALGLRFRRSSVATRRFFWRVGQVHGQKAKRAVDIIAAASALILLSPLLLAVAAMIRLESPGSILFSQTRVGQYGRHFRFWKFRSMYVDAEARKRALMQDNEMDGGVIFKMKNDPRITRVGRVIRRLSIDELPQLWNVLVGDMSLVGPRPPLPDEVAQYSARERHRLNGIPGITCIWQVSGRSDIPFEQQVEMDLHYLHSASLKQNLILLLKTIPAVFSGRGAY